MAVQGRNKRVGWMCLMAILVLSFLFGNACDPAKAQPRADEAQKNRSYVVLAWNNLGMHCYNPDFRDLAVLPPYNTLWAQVVKIGDPPQFVTSGITIEYQFQHNTDSQTKTNFWIWAQQIFDLATPLQPNIGLAGKGLRGQMDLVQDAMLGDHFEAEGIPLTEYSDSDKKMSKPNPYQKAQITVRDVTGEILAETIAVAPVSSELQCFNCHADDGDATTRYPIEPTGKVDTNILSLHDYLNSDNSLAQPSLMSRRPVLCASCHASNALGENGISEVSSLSFAMHNHHNQDLAPDITPDSTDGCYNCHPGPTTQCLRDTMSQNYAFNCTTCHGNMADVASLDREPWLTEPRCDNASCHGAGYGLDQPLYRNSRGHGGIYCAACHDSPHAIAPSREYNDSIKFILLQGKTGTLKNCTTCHATQPSRAFRHGSIIQPSM
jgi:hypothetical protein